MLIHILQNNNRQLVRLRTIAVYIRRGNPASVLKMIYQRGGSLEAGMDPVDPSISDTFLSVSRLYELVGPMLKSWRLSLCNISANKGELVKLVRSDTPK